MLATIRPPTQKLSFREDVTKLQKSDFFVSKLIVFSVTFGRKTKKSQPPTGAARLFPPRSLMFTLSPAQARANEPRCEVEESLFDSSRKPQCLFKASPKNKKPGQKICPGESPFLKNSTEPSAAAAPAQLPQKEPPPTAHFAPAPTARQPPAPAVAPASPDFRLRAQTSIRSVGCSSRCTPGRPAALVPWPANLPADKPHVV